MCGITSCLTQPPVPPLQLLANHVARSLGLNADQPHQLAKTATVE